MDPWKRPLSSPIDNGHQSNQDVDPALQHEPPADQGAQDHPVKEPEPNGPYFAGTVLGLVMLIVGSLGYLLAITLRQQPKLVDPRWGLDQSGIIGSNGNSPSQPVLPPNYEHTKGTTPRINGDQADQRVELACLSGNHPEFQALADPSNYGRRQATDWKGRTVPNSPSLIVLHETVVDESTALALFRSPHNSDAQQASYHVLIGRDGRRIRLVPDSERAYGAGDSDFEGMAVQLKPGLRPSLNNIALHVSLVSPTDGADGDRLRHSGYTSAQYSSLSAQIAQWKGLYGIELSSVVTHQEVDRSGSRRDPRSFNWNQLVQGLRSRWLTCGGLPFNADLERSGVQSQGR